MPTRKGSSQRGQWGEVLHDIKLIVAGPPTSGVGGRVGFDTADHLTRCAGGNHVLVLIVC
jgi:hypothetical protein